jgi:phage-related baseplate assembly protein
MSVLTYDPTYQINLSSLPPPQVIEEVQYQTIYKALLLEFLGLEPAYAALLESDPAVKLVQAFAYREYLLRQRINEAARQQMLRFAEGADLDMLGAFYGVERLIVVPEDLTVDPPVAQVDESDTRYRQRIQDHIIGWSTAGHKKAYRYWAMTADATIVDVNVDSPEDGSVRLSVLGGDALGNLTDGVPSQATLDAVTAMINRDDVKVLTDHPAVVAATRRVANINATMRLLPNTPLQVYIDTVARFTAAMTARIALGSDLTRSWIIAQLHVSGVYEVLLDPDFEDIIAAPNEYVAPGVLNIMNGTRAE